MPWCLGIGKPDDRFKDNLPHYWHTATEAERRAFIYWEAYENARQYNFPIKDREKNWESYLFWRERALLEIEWASGIPMSRD